MSTPPSKRNPAPTALAGSPSRRLAVSSPAGAPTPSPAPTGHALSVAELIRQSNLWRDNYNPLRGLTIARLIAIFEAAERGAYAELQLTLRKAEKRYPVLKALKARRLAAIQKLDWDVECVPNIPDGFTEAQACAQCEFLRSRYDAITNLREAIAQLELSDFRGYAILQKHRYTEGPNAGAVSQLYWLEPWCFARDGFYGDFFYNEASRLGVGLGSCAGILGEANRIGGDALPREDFVIRESESPLYEIALNAFVNWLMGRKDWSSYTEIFGLPNAVVIMPPNIPPGMEATYEAAAGSVASGISGALPNGSDVKFPSAAARSEAPFPAFCEAQDKDVVLAGTGGLLTMLSMPTGIGSGASEQHDDAFDDIAQAGAVKITETLQRDFDLPELAAQFPGQPVLARFKLAAKAQEDKSAVIKDAVALKSIGLQVSEEQLEEKTGYDLEREPAPEPLAPGAPAPTDPADPADPTAPSDPADPAEEDPDPDADREDDETPGPITNRVSGELAANSLHPFAVALASDLQPIFDRLRAILEIQDDAILHQKLTAFLAEFPALEKDLVKDPASARALQPILSAALASGLSMSPHSALRTPKSALL